MIKIISNENMRKSDENTILNGTPSKVLMKNAGHEIFKAFNWYGNILIVCGSGNNAGDGYVLANYLLENKIVPTIYVIKDKYSNDIEIKNKFEEINSFIASFISSSVIMLFPSLAFCVNSFFA